MAGKSASLLTKTQRRRLQNEFEDLDEDAQRRDQQLIRERIRAGVLDFQLLADYPDRQLELAFEDVSETELRAALADTYLAAERIRDLHRYDRDQLLTDARTRAKEVSGEARDVSSLARLDLHTGAEVRRQAEERLGTSRWETRATGLMKLAPVVFAASVMTLLVHDVLIHRYIVARIAAGFAMVALLLCIVGVSLIILLAGTNAIIPAFATVARDAHETGRAAWRRCGPDRLQFILSGQTRENDWDPSPSTTDGEDETPLDRLRQRYAVGELSDEQFERKLEQLLATETLEDAEDRLDARE